MFTDKSFVVKHFETIKKLLLANGVIVDKSSIYFDKQETLFYLDSEVSLAIDKLETQLKDLANENLCVYTIRLCGVKSFGNSILHKDSIPFECLGVSNKTIEDLASTSNGINSERKSMKNF